MLIQLISQHPEALGQIVKRTPIWVWGLLAVLLALGASQLRNRQVTLRRLVITPISMFVFALFGIVSAFGSSGQLGLVLAAGALAAGGMTALVMRAAPLKGAQYDVATRTFSVQGSVVPLLLILGIFLTKYVVGVELAMSPAHTHEASFALPVALLYGAFSGRFAGQVLRLIRLVPTHKPEAAGGWFGARLMSQRDPW